MRPLRTQRAGKPSSVAATGVNSDPATFTSTLPSRITYEYDHAAPS